MMKIELGVACAKDAFYFDEIAFRDILFNSMPNKYVLMEKDNCNCPNPFHTKFTTNNLEEATIWVLQDPCKRKIYIMDKEIEAQNEIGND